MKTIDCKHIVPFHAFLDKRVFLFCLANLMFLKSNLAQLAGKKGQDLENVFSHCYQTIFLHDAHRKFSVIQMRV